MKKLLVELFESYYKDIYTYLYSLCHDASLSEDLNKLLIFQEIWNNSSKPY